MQSIMKFSSAEEVLQRANATEYGLAAGALIPQPQCAFWRTPELCAFVKRSVHDEAVTRNAAAPDSCSYVYGFASWINIYNTGSAPLCCGNGIC